VEKERKLVVEDFQDLRVGANGNGTLKKEI
jgi:hypothetical protein